MATEVNKKQLNSKTPSRGSEIAAVVVLALAVLIFLCLATSSWDDWSWNSTGRSFDVKNNWIGIVGSIVADGLLQTIGLTAYFLPALMALIAWRFYRYQDGYTSLSRVVGYLLFIISTASLFELFGLRGGIVGALFYDYFAWLFSNIGAGILLVAIFAASILMITKLSFVSLSDRLEMPMENLKMRLNSLLERRRIAKEKRQQEKKQAEQIVEKKGVKTPTISAGDVVPNLKEKKESAQEKTPSIFERLKKQAQEQESEKAAVVQEVETPVHLSLIHI